MAAKVPNGSLFHIGTLSGSALTVTAATNANPCVMTSVGHGLANGDYVVVTSGWGRLNNKTVRVANVTADTFELEGIDTSSTTVYPTGSGIGSVEKVSSWTQITQILTISTSGGDQNYATFQYLEDDFEQSIPTQKSASKIEMTLADDPTLAGYIALAAANDDRDPRPIRITASNSAKTLYYSYCSVNKTPGLTVNQVSDVKASLSHLNEPVRYAS